jgi:hypothetical protein
VTRKARVDCDSRGHWRQTRVPSRQGAIVKEDMERNSPAMQARGACRLWQAVVGNAEGGVEVTRNPLV